MRIEFELTAEDFFQAQQAHAANSPPSRPLQVRLQGWLLTFLWIGSGFLYWIYGPWGERNREVNPIIAYIILPQIPWVLFLAVIWLNLLRGRSFAGTWKRGSRIGIARLPLRKRLRPAAVQMVVMGVLLPILAFASSRRGGMSMTDTAFAAAVVMTLFPAFIYGIWAALLATTTARPQSVRAWELQTHLHARQTFEIDVNGVVLATLHHRNEYRWHAIVGSLETPGQFLLYVSPAAFHIIPKRALATPEESAALGHLLQSALAPDLSAFPVQAAPATTTLAS